MSKQNSTTDKALRYLAGDDTALTPTHPLHELAITLGSVVTDRDEDTQVLEEAKELVESIKKDAGLDSLGNPTGERWFIVTGRMYGDDEDSVLRYQCADRKQAVSLFRGELEHDYEKYSAECDDEGPGYVYVSTVFDCGTNKPEVA